MCSPSETGSGVFGTPGEGGEGRQPGFRDSGLDFLGDISWGAHLAQFYRTRDDLIEIAVPYLRAGLENNEFCLWVATDLIDPEGAEEAMAAIWPGCREYIDQGQMRFVDHNGWYYRQGPFEPGKMVEITLGVVNSALQNEYQGMRIISGMSWIDPSHWGMLTEFEESLGRLGSSHPLLTICSYHLDKCGQEETLGAARCHGAVIVKEEGRWQVLSGSDLEAAAAEEPAEAPPVSPADTEPSEAEQPAEAPPVSPADTEPSEAEQQMQVVFEGVRDAIVILDMAGKVLRANRGVPDLFGYSESSILGKQFALLRMFPPSRAAEMFSAQARTLAGHDVPPFEVDAVAESGQKLEVEVRISPVKRKARVVGAVAVIRDITMRRKTEEKLWAAQQRNQLVVQYAREGIMVIQDGTIRFANPRMIDITGYPEDEILGKPVKELVHPEDQRAVTVGRFRRLRGEEPSHVQDLRVIDRGGDVKWAEFNAVLFAWDGRPADLYFVNDITQRKQAQEALIQGERNYRRLFETSLDGLVVVDTETGKVVLANPASAAMFGFGAAAEMQGLDPLECVVEEDRERVSVQLAGAAAGGDAHRPQELRAVTRSGAEVRISAACVGTEFQRRPAVLISIKDITGQRQVEEKLSQSQTDLQVLFDGVQDGIIRFDGAGRVVRVNHRVLDLTGLPAEEFLDQELDALRVFTPEAAAAIRSAVQGQLSGKDAGHFELEGCTGSGQALRLEARITLLGQGENVQGGIAVLRDISRSDEAEYTLRGEMEKALRESEHRYRLLAENISDVIWVTDLDLKPRFVSPSMERLLGYSAEESMSAGLEQMVTRESIQEATARTARATSFLKKDPGKTFKPGSMELKMKRRDGSTVWMDTTVTVGYDSAGKPVEFMGVLRDISERKTSEKAVGDSEGRFRSLIESTSDWVWEVSDKLVYTYVSRNIYDILGFEPEEVIGKTPVDLMPLKEANRVARVLANALADKKPFAFMENICLHKDGHKVVLESSGVPFFDAGGNVSGFRGMNRDVTERKRTEEEAQESFRKLQRTVEGTIQAIALTVETRDPYTAGHQRRVTKLAHAIAREMSLSNDQIQRIRISGLLHDLGKIFIPTEILSKPGQLTDVEFAIIKSHPQAGYEILKNIEFPWPISDIVVQHHERMDGSGYPAGLKGDEIVMEARILIVADVVEAMSSHRPYRPAIGLEKALKEIVNNKGVLYDASVVEACMRVFGSGAFKFEG